MLTAVENIGKVAISTCEHARQTPEGLSECPGIRTRSVGSEQALAGEKDGQGSHELDSGRGLETWGQRERRAPSLRFETAPDARDAQALPQHARANGTLMGHGAHHNDGSEPDE